MIFNIRYIDLIIVYINTLGFFKNALTLLIAFKYTNKFIIFAKFTYPGIPLSIMYTLPSLSIVIDSGDENLTGSLSLFVPRAYSKIPFFVNFCTLLFSRSTT